jgi:hypothetical protein
LYPLKKRFLAFFFGPYLHLFEESIDAEQRAEEDIRGQVVPDLEAAQNVSGPIAHATRNQAVVAARGLRAAVELELDLERGFQLREQREDGGRPGGECRVLVVGRGCGLHLLVWASEGSVDGVVNDGGERHFVRLGGLRLKKN